MQDVWASLFNVKVMIGSSEGLSISERKKILPVYYYEHGFFEKMILKSCRII